MTPVAETLSAPVVAADSTATLPEVAPPQQAQEQNAAPVNITQDTDQVQPETAAPQVAVVPSAAEAARAITVPVKPAPEATPAKPAPDSDESTSRAPPRSFMLGSWEYDGTEFGERVHVIWRVTDDGVAQYLMNPGEKNVLKMTGKWTYDNGTLLETFANGTNGRADVRMISQNEFELRIIDNGDARYRNLKRRYRRRG